MKNPATAAAATTTITAITMPAIAPPFKGFL